MGSLIGGHTHHQDNYLGFLKLGWSWSEAPRPFDPNPFLWGINKHQKLVWMDFLGINYLTSAIQTHLRCRHPSEWWWECGLRPTTVMYPNDYKGYQAYETRSTNPLQPTIFSFNLPQRKIRMEWVLMTFFDWCHRFENPWLYKHIIQWWCSVADVSACNLISPVEGRWDESKHPPLPPPPLYSSVEEVSAFILPCLVEGMWDARKQSPQTRLYWSVEECSTHILPSTVERRWGTRKHSPQTLPYWFKGGVLNPNPTLSK